MEKDKTISDEKLVLAAQKGDKQAFAELVGRYEKKIYNLGYRISGNREDASDILQDTFLQVFKKIKTFKGKSKFSTWLYRIATNSALMRKRKDSKNRTVSMESPAVMGTGEEIKKQFTDDWSKKPLDIVENRELGAALRKYIDELPQEYRAALILRDINGIPNEEVAKILKISLPAVKSRVHRARLFIREKLTGYFKNIQEIVNGY